MAFRSRRLATAFPGGKDRRPGLTRQGSDTIADPPRPTCRGADRAETLPKIATMERRWAQRPSVIGAMGRYVNPPPACRVKARLTGASQAPERLTALHPPLGGVEKIKPRARKRAARTSEQREVDRVTREPVAGDGVARYPSPEIAWDTMRQSAVRAHLVPLACIALAMIS